MNPHHANDGQNRGPEQQPGDVNAPGQQQSARDFGGGQIGGQSSAHPGIPPSGGQFGGQAAGTSAPPQRHEGTYGYPNHQSGIQSGNITSPQGGCAQEQGQGQGQGQQNWNQASYPGRYGHHGQYGQYGQQAPFGQGPQNGQGSAPFGNALDPYSPQPGLGQGHEAQGGWQQVDQHQDLYDPDYHQWRTEQMRSFDEDYRRWRQERFRRFSEEFNQWRQSRGGSQPGGESPQTGDVKAQGHEPWKQGNGGAHTDSDAHTDTGSDTGRAASQRGSAGPRSKGGQ